MEAIILAGGRGTRLGKITENLPKPMVPVHNRPFLEILMDYWLTQGVKHFVLSVGYKAEIIENHFGDHYKDIPVSYCTEQSPLGTGGAVLKALNCLKKRADCLVMNGDTYFNVALADLQAFHKQSESIFTLSLFHIDQPDRYEAVELSDANRIKAFIGRNRQGGSANGGVYLLNPDRVAKLSSESAAVHSLERDSLPAWAAAGENIFGFVSQGTFLDIGIPEDYQRAEQVIPSA